VQLQLVSLAIRISSARWTHERRFAGLLERKLAPRDEGITTLSISFLGWDRSGPNIEIQRVEPQLVEIDARLAAA